MRISEETGRRSLCDEADFLIADAPVLRMVFFHSDSDSSHGLIRRATEVSDRLPILFPTADVGRQP